MIWIFLCLILIFVMRGCVSGQCPGPGSSLDWCLLASLLSLRSLPGLAGALWSLTLTASSATHCLLTTFSPKYLFWPGRQPRYQPLSLVGRSPPLSRPISGRILIKLCGREGLSLTLWQTPFNLSLLAISTLLFHRRSFSQEGISTRQSFKSIAFYRILNL